MSSSSPLFIRLLQNTFTNSNSSTGFQDAETPESQDAYEFVAFLLWYLFLVVCCVLPTCCAYRRRRLMEARIAQQQASFDQLHQQNVFILSNLHMRPDMDGEEARAERTKRITEALKITTFVSALQYCIEFEFGFEFKLHTFIQVLSLLAAQQVQHSLILNIPFFSFLYLTYLDLP
jgi:hypothetical protein